ncbi:MAG: hypothetical protein MRJ92_02350 [Nitrospira sp.]|nr:hypothetical protein [Nitrospira sp.]
MKTTASERSAKSHRRFPALTTDTDGYRRVMEAYYGDIQTKKQDFIQIAAGGQPDHSCDLDIRPRIGDKPVTVGIRTAGRVPASITASVEQAGKGRGATDRQNLP